MKVKSEVIDLSYEDSVEMSRSSEVDSDSEAMLVAQRIKEEFDEEKQQPENGRNRPRAAASSEQRCGEQRVINIHGVNWVMHSKNSLFIFV